MTSLIEERCGAVDQRRLMAWLREFAQWEKLSGTPGERQGIAFLKQQLDALGLATRVISHDAFISLPLEARVVAGERTLRCITHSFSQPSPPAGVSAPLVYLAKGSEADYAGTDVTGRIVVLEGLAVPAAADRASRAGAVGQIHVSPYRHIHEMCVSPIWGSPSDETVKWLPRTVVCSIDHADGEFVKDFIARGAQATATLHAAVDTGWRKTPILIADLAANESGEAPFVLLSGHQDTWYYGVMDNGSANVAMLEIARLCAEMRPRLKRSLRIAFWSGHSHGRYSGSAWYADEHWHELNSRCVAHVNVDSLGGTGNTVLADAPAAAELLGLARQAVGRWSKETLTEQRMSRAGDQSFWGIGIPSIFNTLSHEPVGKGVNVVAGFMGAGRKKAGGGMGWWWHTPEDLIDKIDPELLVRDTRVYLEVVLRLLTDPVLPFDHREQVGQLRSIVSELQSTVGARCDLTGLAADVEVLHRLAGELHATTGTVTRRGAPEQIEAVNCALIALSRILTPLEYTCGDRFTHDPALGQSAFPALDGLRRLARAADAEEQFTRVAARQGRNRVQHAVREAISLLESRLAAMT